MNLPKITKRATSTEVAAIVSQGLEAAGIVATLSGGGAVTAYTQNRYQSADLDFVTTAMLDELKPALEPLGFVHTGTPRLSVFEHPSCQWYLEFLPAPLAFGSTYIDPSNCSTLKTTTGPLRIITATHSLMDRLIAAAVWHDPQSLEQAILVATNQHQQIDWQEIRAWINKERIEDSREVLAFFRALAPGKGSH